MNEQSAERRPIGWWLRTAGARIEQAFEDVFESQSITRRGMAGARASVPCPESEVLMLL